MIDLIGLIIFGIIYYYLCFRDDKIVNKKLENYDFSNVDNYKMTLDQQNGIDCREIRRRTLCGYYNKDRSDK